MRRHATGVVPDRVFAGHATGIALPGEARLHARRVGGRLASAGRALVRLAAGLALAGALASLLTRSAIERHLSLLERQPDPAVRPLNISTLFDDPTPVRVSLSLGWSKTPYIAAADDVRNDVRLWRLMRFDDWDKVRNPLRERALASMLARYDGVLASPGRWDTMTPHDWDLVPQPMRALAFVHMTQYWSGFYQVGAAYDLPRRAVASTLAAIVMTESWFEHRAVHVNEWGNRDLGLAQASDHARAVMERLAASGDVDVRFTDED